MMSGKELISNIRREIEDEENGNLLVFLYAGDNREVFYMNSYNYEYLDYVCEDCNLEMFAYNR